MRMMSWTALSIAAGMSSCSLMATPVAPPVVAPVAKAAVAQNLAAPAPTQASTPRALEG
jgi:hypothetical protein